MSSSQPVKANALCLSGWRSEWGKSQRKSGKEVEWHVLVLRREEHYLGRSAMEIKVHWRRKRGRLKLREYSCIHRVRADITETGLSGGGSTYIMKQALLVSTVFFS